MELNEKKQKLYLYEHEEAPSSWDICVQTLKLNVDYVDNWTTERVIVASNVNTGRAFLNRTWLNQSST